MAASALALVVAVFAALVALASSLLLANNPIVGILSLPIDQCSFPSNGAPSSAH